MLSLTSSLQAPLKLAEQSPPAETTAKSLTTRQAFQNFVAGTFYSQMLKAMRSTESTVQYMNGGQAEKMFRNQLDQQLAENLARENGAVFADPLFDNFQRDQAARQSAAGMQVDYLA